MEKLYSVLCHYTDIWYGRMCYLTLENVTKEEAERFVASKENCGDFYEIIEVKK